MKAIQKPMLTLLLCCLAYSGFGAVTVTPATSATICPTLAVGGGATAYTTLSNIIILEGATTDISVTSATPDILTLAPPTGWQFNTSVVPTITYTTGKDITGISASYVSGSLVIDVTCGGTANIDQITISNLQVEATSTSSFPGNITASTASGFFNIIAGTTNFGSLQLNASPSVPSVTISGSPSGAICFGTGVTFTPAPTNGGTSPTYQWYVNGTVTASGSTYSSTTLTNGNTVSAIMTSNASGCVYPATANSNTVTVTVNPAPTTVTVSGGGTYCGSATLTASNGGSGTIYYEGTTTGGTATTSPSTTVTVTSSGTYYFRAQSSSGCWGTEGSVSVVINTPPTAVTVTGGGTYCGGSPTLTASGGTGGTIYFQNTTSGGTSTASPSTTVSVTSTGTYYFNAQSSAGCWGTQGSASVTINPGPTDNAGLPQTICSGGSVTLAGSIGGSATASTWSAPSGTFSDVTNPTATYTPSISSGNVTLTLTTNNPSGSPCVAATSTVVITVNQAPTANAGLAQTVCSNGSITLAGSIGGSATSSTWSAASGTFSNVNSTTSTYTPTISSGPVTLTLTSNNPGGAPCSAAVSTMVVTVDQAATANAGAAQIECGDGTLTLAGTIGGAATSSTWTASSGTFSNASSTTSTYTPTVTSGAVTLTLTTNDPDGSGPCTAATSTVTVTVDQPATANAGLPQTICSSGSATLAGTIGGGATSSTWTASSGIFSNASSVSSTYTPTITSGNVTLTLTTNDPDGSGPCTAATSTVVITVNQASTDNAGSPQTVCSGTPVTLAGTLGGAATAGTWSASSGTFSSATSLSTTYTPSITSGNVTLTLTSNNPGGAPCTAAVSSLVITVDAGPTDNAGVAQTVCSNGTITLAGTIGGSATTSTWTSSAGGVFSNINSTTSTYTPAVLSGMVTLTLTTNNPSGPPCSAATSSVVITVNEAALVNAGPAQTVCQGSTITLDGSEGGSTTTTTWTASSGTFSNAFLLGSTYTPSIASGPVTLTLTGNDPDGPGPCTAMTSTMTVTVNQAPTDNAGLSQTVCSNGSIVLAGTVGGSATAGTWSASSGTFSSASSLTSTYTPTISSGPVTLTLTSNNPGGAPCAAAVSTMTVTVDQAPTDNAGTATAVCGGGAITLAGTLGGSATSSTWSASTGTFSNTASLTSTYTPIITSGAVILTLTSNSGPGPCAAAVSTVTVTVDPAATDNAGTALSVCAGGTVTLAGTIGGSATSSTWNATSGSFSNVNSLTSTYTPSLTSGTINLTLTTNNPGSPCSAAVSTVPITINPLPTAVTVTGAGAYCTDETLTASNGGSGIIYYEGNTSNGTSIASPSATEIETVSGTYYFRAQSLAGCWGPQGSAIVTISALPTAFTVTGGGGYCTGGSGAVVGLSGSQSGYSYQLYCDYSPVGAAVLGTGAAFNFASETVAGYYTVIATNTATMCTNNMTGGVAVAILPLPNVYTLTGGGAYCAGGTGVDVAMTGSDLGVNYQLLLGGVASGLPVAGTGLPLDFSDQTTAGNYTVVGTSSGSGCTSTMTGTVTVTVNPLPTVYTVTGGGTQCAGGAGVAIGLSGSQSTATYQVYNGSVITGVPVTGTGGAFTLGLMTASGTYTVSATTIATGCTNNMTGSAVVTINPLPTAYAVTGGGGYCAGGTGVHVGLANSASGFNYQLYRGATGLATLPGPGALDFGLQTTAGNYTVVATNTVTACTSTMTGTVTVTVNPLPTVYNVTGGGAYCAGDTGIHVDLSGSDAGVNYYVYASGTLTSTVAGTGVLGSLDLGLQTVAGTYTVSATNPATGCSNNMSGSVNVSVNAAPTAYTVTGGGSECSGGAGFTVGLSNSQPGTYSYQLYNAGTTVGGAMGGTGSSITFGTETAAGTYTVVATNTSTGCTSLMDGSAVIVNYPLPTIYTVGGGGSYCSGGAGVSITTTNSTVGVNYQVFLGGTPIGTAVAGTGSGLNITETTAGTYTIKATNATTGCNVSMTGSATVTVNPLPAAITGATDICIGTSTTLSDATGTGSWSSSNTAIGSIGTSGTVTGVSTGTYSITYTLPITGCYRTTTDTVTSMPTVSSISGPSILCQGSTITLTDGSVGGVWTSSNTSVASVGSSSGIVTGVASGTASLTYSFAPVLGCPTATAIVPETVNPSPSVGSISSSTSSLCAGLTILLSDATAGGTWSSSNTSVATVNTTGTVTGITAGTVVISYTLSNSSGCSTSATSAITVGTAMPAAFALPAGSATLCNGNAANLSVVTTGTITVTYQWAVGGVDIAGANSSSYTTFTPGLYTAVISNGSCSEILPAINVVPQPDPIITRDSIAGFLYTGSFSTYEWFYNGVVIPGATTDITSEDTTAPGVYRVLVSDANGCFDTSAPFIVTVDSALATGNIIKGNDISIYPNPATSILHIDAPGRVFVTISGADGRTYMERKEAVTVNISELADGVYFVMIYDVNNNLLKADHFVKVQ